MTDADVLRLYLQREKRWLQTLQTLRGFHESQMGKVTTQIQWVAGGELGRFSWLGYYWHREMIWFGFGLLEGVWRPLIEADNRSSCSEVLESMRTQLSGEWQSVVTAGHLYRRLWSPSEVVAEPERELEWWRARSRELHEYLVQPEL